MATAGDPAPTTIEPRTPTPYRAIGACTLSAAALIVIPLSAVVTAEPDAIAIRQVLIVTFIALAGIGLWAFGLHRSRVNHELAEARAAARAAATETLLLEQVTLMRQDLRDLGALMLRTGGKRDLENITIVLDKMSSHVGQLLVKRLASDQVQESLQEQVMFVREAMAGLGEDIQNAVRHAYAAGFVDAADGGPPPSGMASVTRLEPR